MLSRNGLADQIRLANNPARLRVPAFQIINALQQVRATGGEQVVGTAVALIAMCESAGVPLTEVITRAARIMGDVEGPFTAHLQSVRDYARNELRGHF